jgi:enoyl-CoA hydratase/carnithine racemase
MNAWHRPTRNEVLDCLRRFNADDAIRAIIMTGAGNRAFCGGQDFMEAETFDGDGAVTWIEEWRVLYGAIRALDKPLIAALNGVAAGSGFQAALVADVYGRSRNRTGIAPGDYRFPLHCDFVCAVKTARFPWGGTSPPSIAEQ